MAEIVKLATQTIDIDDVAEIDEQEDYILLNCSRGKQIILTGSDAEVMRVWLDEGREKLRKYLLSEGWSEEALNNKTPAPIVDEPLF